MDFRSWAVNWSHPFLTTADLQLLLGGSFIQIGLDVKEIKMEEHTLEN